MIITLDDLEAIKQIDKSKLPEPIGLKFGELFVGEESPVEPKIDWRSNEFIFHTAIEYDFNNFEWFYNNFWFAKISFRSCSSKDAFPISIKLISNHLN